MTTWLHRVVANACLDRLRAMRLRETEPLPENLDRWRRMGTTLIKDPVEIKEQRGVVAAALGALNADQRAAPVLVDMERYSVEEAAQILGCAPGTVKSRCARGRARAVLQLANPGNLRQHRCRHLRRSVDSRTGKWLVASTCPGDCAVGARRKHHLLAHQGLSEGRRVAIDRATLLEADHDRGQRTSWP